MRIPDQPPSSLRHLEWFIRDPVPDPEATFYEVLPFWAEWADCILHQLFDLVDLNIAQINKDPALERRVREAFDLIIDAAKTAQGAVEYNAIERDIKNTRSEWRDRLRNLGFRQFDDLISDRFALAAPS